MRKHNWKAWVAGIALAQVIVLGVDVVLLWPMPSAAEQATARIGVGMTEEEVAFSIRDYTAPWPGVSDPRGGRAWWFFKDGSCLEVRFGPSPDENTRPAVFLHATPPPPVPPLTRLRRTLARLFPALKE